MVEGLRRMHLDRYGASGAELIMGQARFAAPRTVDVELADGGNRRISGDRVFLNLGTHATVPDLPGLVAAEPMTHVELLDLDRLPEHLIVMGGGYVGIELAQAMRRFGAQVTVIEQGPQLARSEDGEGWVTGTDLLVAVGRTPNTAGIVLERAGVERTEAGYIKVDEHLATTAPGVWAMGECAGSPQFTHVAFDDFRVVRDHLNGGSRTTRDRLVPFCMFTDPELARVGRNEAEARRLGMGYRLLTLPMAGVLRTRTLSEPRGLMKMLIAADSDEILGFTVFGAEASELMIAVQVAMMARLPYTALRGGIFTHPTAGEGLTVLLSGAPRLPEAVPIALAHDAAQRTDQPPPQRVPHGAQQPAGRCPAGTGQRDH